MIRFKICCIQDIEEMRMAVDAGASAVGLVSAMPSGPGPISEERIAEIADATPPGIATFLLTSLQDAASIIEQNRRCRCNTIQIVDELTSGTHAEISAALPGVRVVQVIHVIDEKTVEEAGRLAPHVDALLLDSGAPQKAVKELGGTGRVHDWQLSRAIVEAVDIPVWLAGGLNPGNAAEAASSVQPFALDVCSGLRTDGALDRERLAAFVRNIELA